MKNNQVVVFSTSIPTKINASKWRKYVGLMPEDVKTRIERFINPEDKCRLLFGRLLLMEGLKFLDLDVELIHKIRYTNFYKPFFENGIEFNISHSGDIVLCTLSTGRKVGIDVEKIREIDLPLYYSTFTPNQREALRKAPDVYDYFFHLWTLKESVIKAEGLGLSLRLDCIETDSQIAMLNNTPWFVYRLQVGKGYSAHLASDEPVVIIQGLTAAF